MDKQFAELPKIDHTYNQESLPANDPSSYFKNEVCVGLGTKIDPANDRHWPLTKNGQQVDYYYHPDFGSIILGSYPQEDGSPDTLIIAGENKFNHSHFSHEIKPKFELGEESLLFKNLIVDAVRDGVGYLPPAEKFRFIEKIIDLQTSLIFTDINQLNFKIAELFVDSITRNTSYPPAAETILESTTIKDGQKINKLNTLLTRLVYLSDLDEREVYKQRIKYQSQDLLTQDENDIFNIIVQAAYELYDRKHKMESIKVKARDFDVRPFIGNSLPTDATMQEVTQRLTKHANSQIPHTSFAAEVAPEFVDAQDIIGRGDPGTTWDSLIGDRRADDHILSLAKALQSGTPLNKIDSDPIQIARIKGKLYMNGGGTHRVAALKVLGVTKFPALVSTYK